MNNFKRFLFSFFVLSTAIFTLSFVPEPVAQVKPKSIMVVFVHGTVLPYFSLRATLSWCKKRKTSSYVDNLKRFGVYRYQPIDKLGLRPIDPYFPAAKQDSLFFGIHTARLFQKMYDATHPGNADTLVFYTYNWSGKLCRKERERAGAALHDALLAEREKIAADELCVLGHSHGMNVILNAAKKYVDSEKKLTIDKAVFFGGPVQSETEALIHSPMFKNGAVHIFSGGDRVQVLDYFSSRDRSARRMFRDVPSNSCQIKVQTGVFRPLHRELWMWGSKGAFSFLYRKWLPLHPVPVMIFAPAIIALAQEIDSTQDAKGLCSLRIDKGDNTIVLSCGCDQRIARHFPISEIVHEGSSLL